MAQQTRTTLKTYFNTGDTPTEAQFIDLIDSLHSISDDGTAQIQPSEGAFANGDKTKLDGIEAGADVTDTANVTAAGALMDSEVTDLAGIKALDTTDILFADVADQLTAGFTAAVDDDGAAASPYTPDPDTGNYKRVTNDGAMTINPPTMASGEATSITILLTNTTGAGAITTSGFTKVSGDTLTTTTTDEFLLFVDAVDVGGTTYSSLNVIALQ